MDFRRLLDYFAVSVHRFKNNLAKNSAIYRREEQKRKKAFEEKNSALREAGVYSDEAKAARRDLVAKDELLKYNEQVSSQLREENNALGQRVTSAEMRAAEAEAGKAALEKRLVEELPRVRRIITQVLQACNDVRTGRDIIEDRVNANRSATRSLEEWMQKYAEPLERRTKAAEEEAIALRGAAFRTAIELVIKAEPRANEIPFFYYDFVNRNFFYTPTALKYLGNESKSENLTLSKLLRLLIVDKKKMHELITSLRGGERLVHYAVRSRENRETLYLTSHVVNYKVDDKIHAVGVGVFLYDPGFKHIIDYARKPEGTKELEKGVGGIIALLGDSLRKLKTSAD